MKYVLTVLFFISIIYCQGQNKQDYNWLFGRDESFSPGQTGYMMDFNTNPVNLTKRNNGIGIKGHNVSISDEEGRLLFYSNGCAVLNRSSEIMSNGHGIVDTVWMEMWNEDCKFGYSGGQNIMILPNPNGSDSYYLLNKPYVFNGFNVEESLPIWYNLVDMDLNGGKGDVILKNEVLYNEKNTLRNFLTAISHKNGKDYWIIQPLVEDSIFTTFLLTADGFERYPDQNTHEFFNRWRSSAGGTAKFSPDGSKYALYTFTDQLHIYDFDRTTGVLSNHQKIYVYPDPDQNEVRFCSVEWSSNSRFVYTASSTELHQIDLWEEEIQDGVQLIAEWDGTNDPFPNVFYLMAQGPDCKIYMCSTSANSSYHVIQEPNKLGDGCNFCQSCLELPEAANFGSMPNFPRFRVDAAEKCDSTIDLVLGLPVWFKEPLEVYPNPCNGIINVKIPPNLKNGHIVIYNLEGMIVYESSFSNISQKTIDISKRADGTYIVEVFSTMESNQNLKVYQAQIIKTSI